MKGLVRTLVVFLMLVTQLSPAQAQRVPKVGVILGAAAISELEGSSPTDATALAFVEALKARGWMPGQSVQLVWKSLELDFDRLPGLIDGMAKLPVDVLVVAANWGAVEAKKRAPALPVVVAAAYHPDEYGIVASLAKPGGMITGALLEPGRGINEKRIALLKEAVPKLTRLAYLSFSSFSQDVHDEVQAAGRAQGIVTFPLPVDALGGFEKAFEEATRQRTQALLVGTSQTFLKASTQQTLHALAIKHRIPVLHCYLAPGENGGLFAYSTDLRDNYRMAARQVDSILRGARPGDIPMEQAQRFVFTVNLRAARAIGLEVPRSVLAQADRVFE